MPLILLLFALILLIGLKNGELAAAARLLRALRPWKTIAGATGLVALYLLMDAMGLHVALRSLGWKVPFRHTLMVTVRGQYYYYITPGASGGQFAQVYYLRELGVPTGVSTCVLVSHFVTFQGMLALLMVLFCLPQRAFILRNIAPHLPLLVLGFAVNVAMVGFTLLCAFSRGPIALLIAGIASLARRFRLSRHPERLEKRLHGTANLFHDNMQTMRAHPAGLAFQFLFAGLQQLCLMLVLYLCYRGLGEDSANPLQMIGMALAQYVSAAYAPTPGASGAQEGVFAIFFQRLLPDGKTFAAMLLWRLTTFYLPLLLSVVSIALYRKRKLRAEELH